MGDFCNKIYSPTKKSKCDADFQQVFGEMKSIIITRSLFVTDPMSCVKLDGYQRRFCMEKTLADANDISICDRIKAAAVDTQAVGWIKDDCLYLLSKPSGQRHF